MGTSPSVESPHCWVTVPPPDSSIVHIPDGPCQTARSSLPSPSKSALILVIPRRAEVDSAAALDPSGSLSTGSGGGALHAAPASIKGSKYASRTGADERIPWERLAKWKRGDTEMVMIIATS